MLKIYIYIPILFCLLNNIIVDNRIINTENEVKKMNDIEIILENTMPFLEQQILKNNEFHPIAASININNDFSFHASNDPELNSDETITYFKDIFSNNRNEYQTVAIFYNITTTDIETNIKNDAIAVFVESKNLDEAYNLVYKYIISDSKTIDYIGSYKTSEKKQLL